MSEKSVDEYDLSLLMNPKKKGAASIASSRSRSLSKSRSSVMSESEESEASGTSPVQMKKSRTPSEASSFSSLSSLRPPQMNTSKPKVIDNEKILNMKRELLFKFENLEEKKRVRVPKKFSLNSCLEEMEQEYDRLKKNLAMENSVKMQRKMLISFVSMVEFANKKFSPFNIHLDGWSESMDTSIMDYDEIFEELHEKYQGKLQIPAELKLVFMIGASAFMFHLTHSMFKQFPGLEEVTKQNPDLLKHLQSATMNTMKNNSKEKNESNGLFDLFGSFIGGGGVSKFFGGGETKQPHNQQQPTKTQMRGPTDVDEILRGLDNQDIDEKIELVSNSDITDIPDDASVISGGKGKGKRSLAI